MKILSETLVVVDRPNPCDGDRELLVGQQKRGQWDNLLNFPGGKVNRGEAMASAAARELLEETGLVLDPTELSHIGNLIIDDYRTASRRFGMVAIFGAHLSYDPALLPNENEFDCFWIKPTDRNILLNMPRDVGYWLPLAFQQPREPFTCLRTVDAHGGDWYATLSLTPGQRPTQITQFASSL